MCLAAGRGIEFSAQSFASVSNERARLKWKGLVPSFIELYCYCRVILPDVILDTVRCSGTETKDHRQASFSFDSR